MTKREASRETLERLAEAVDAWYDSSEGEQPGWCQESKDVFRALAAYRAEITPPLRTRAEVDAEIVSEIREWFHNSGNYPVGLADHTRANLLALCREPTAPEGETPPAPLPWRVGVRVPEHLYDANDRPIATMPTAEIAARVVAAVNGEGE